MNFKTLAVLSSVLLLGTAAFVSQTSAQRTAGTAKLVLFDLTKRETAANADWTIDGAYSDWADALRARGYTVRTLRDSSLSVRSLEGVSVYIVPEPQNPFSDDERSALSRWVQAGGGLLMIGDHRDSDRDSDGWDSPEVFSGWDGKTPNTPPQRFRKSLDSRSTFGIGFSFGSSFNDGVKTASALTRHPLLEGRTSGEQVNRAGVYVGTSLELGGAKALMGARGQTYLAANEVGAGRVVGYGDSSAFADATLSDGRRNRYDNWRELDNAKLAVNMVAWLAGDLGR